MGGRAKSPWAGFLVFFLLFSPPLAAGSLHLDTDFLGQVRENETSVKEFPFNGYLGVGVTDIGKWRFGAQTDMRLFRDFSRSLDDYDLYQAVLHAKPLEALAIDFGRQFINQGFSVQILDGLQTTLFPSNYLRVAFFGGIPRTVERGDFNRNDGWMTGLSLGLLGVPGTEAAVHFLWRKNDIRHSDLKENDQVLVGANLSHRWQGPVGPNLYGLLEYDVTSKVAEAETVGIDVAPSQRIRLNVEGNYFNANRDTTRPTILGLLTRGRTLSARFSSTWTLVPRFLDLVESYSYQRVEIQEGVRENGHLLEIGFPVSVESVGFFCQPAYDFAESFGGNLHGGRVFFHEDFTDRLYGEVAFDFTRYEKITHNDDTALSTLLWAGYEILKGWTVAGGFEYNRNNLFERDLRGSFRIQYHYDHGI